ncbi:uncharacterized protein V1516DRAFT_681420 [Lipomyces oligophaga]|uniref:uncharacterized protein n=1 Tax=Lipomyces oligophaga TaxID=45792 RepID=UPI0034CEEC35
MEGTETIKSKRKRRPYCLPRQEVPCKFHMSGGCNRGDTCWFKHDMTVKMNPRDPAVAAQLVEGEVNSEQRGSGSETDALDSTMANIALDDIEVCSICLEVPEVYGLLLTCDHVFCLECIRKWRGTNGLGSTLPSPVSQLDHRESVMLLDMSESDDTDTHADLSGRIRLFRSRNPVIAAPTGQPNRASVKTHRLTKCCPLCRRLSDYVLPSSVLPARSGAVSDNSGILTKSEILKTYRQTARRITCKYFKATLRCPFGNECLYSHPASLVFSERDYHINQRKRPKQYRFSDIELGSNMEYFSR